MPTITDLAKAITNALQPETAPATSEEDVYGERIDAPEYLIEDGNYGDPFQDDRPEFIRDSTRGWRQWIIFRR